MRIKVSQKGGTDMEEENIWPMGEEQNELCGIGVEVQVSIYTHGFKETSKKKKKKE